MSFFWYDYETFGSDASVDRPVQFAGVRTNRALRPIGEPVVLYCRPAPDYLPTPEACLVHGMTPTELLQRGVSEADFARRIHAELSQPGTCAVGYNAIRFDHEVTRFLLYRNLRDPYAWHWRNGNTRWDLIDLVRAAYALRPGGISWPTREDGAPSFRLEDVAAANGLRHASPHEAFADVKTTLDLARLIRDREPELFEHHLMLRNRRDAVGVVRKPFIWVSSLVGADRRCATLMAPVALHPSDSNGVIAFDLAHDPSNVVDLAADELRQSIFDRGRVSPLYTIKVNACPFVAPAKWLKPDLRDRLGMDAAELKSNYRVLRSADSFGARVRAAYHRDFDDAGLDVDAALYTTFLPDGDREKLQAMLDADSSLSGASSEVFEDPRVGELVFRYRARNFPRTLNDRERERWRSHCRTRHLEPDDEGRAPMDSYDAAIASLREQHAASSEEAALLDDLADYGRRLRKWLN